jgi:WhiB family redox-sensing transcriptional regulator
VAASPAQGECGSGKWDPEVWFPLSYGEAQVAPAAAICSFCAIRATCLEGALERREEVGVWGGLTPAERMGLIQADRRHIANEAAIERADRQGEILAAS